jgi:hypothetical protein
MPRAPLAMHRGARPSLNKHWTPRGTPRAFTRDGLDYQSAAIMQFNAAAALHDLGDQDGAQKALEAAIAMDRDYDFRDDAADNIRLLQHWRGEDESDARIAELMKDFPGAYCGIQISLVQHRCGRRSRCR